MLKITHVLLATLLCARMAMAAETPEPPPTRGIDLMELIERSAARFGKRFIVDPRVRGNVQIVGIDPARISYQELQAVLAVHGFVTTPEIEGTIRIVPESNARQLPMPIVGATKPAPGDEDIVMKSIDVGSLDAMQLVPILRPLLPQYAHLVAHGSTNSLIVVARYANVKSLEALVNDLRKRPIVKSEPDAKQQD